MAATTTATASPTARTSAAVVGDGRDNDGNGFADCADFSCRNNPYVTVCDSEDVCDDGIDNDGDRFTDCADSECSCTDVCRPGCQGPEDTVERCSDGFDNDGNNFVDCNDFSCSRSTNPAVMALCTTRVTENTLALCMNNIDDDANGYTDCDDRQCTMTSQGASTEAAAYCAARAENTLERCFDGVDNDENGFVDCRDYGCSRSPDPAVVEACRRVGEATIENCRDGIDNDDNGYRDCADNGCRFVVLAINGSCADSTSCPAGQSCYRGQCISLTSACTEGAFFDDRTTTQGDIGIDLESTFAERVAMSVAQCTDGIDNDGDGFTDCEDWECNYNPHVIDAAGNPICRTSGGSTCLSGPNAGRPCANDAACGGRVGSCDDLGFAGQPFVCP